MTIQQIDVLGQRINLEWTVAQEVEEPYMWAATFHVRDNSVGDLELFVVNEALETFLGTASPYQEQVVPRDPAVNDEGETRTSSIRVRHQAMEDAFDAVSAIANDLEEYLKSKVVFNQQLTKVTHYTFEEQQ
jgi:hypothetical protein